MRTITRNTEEQRWDYAHALGQKLAAVAGRQLTERELMTVDGREMSDDYFWFDPASPEAEKLAEKDFQFILDCPVDDLDRHLAAALLFGGKTS